MAIATPSVASLTDTKLSPVIIFIIFVQIFIIYSGITIFGTTPINIKEITFIFIVSLTIIPIDFIRKIILKRIKGNTGV